MIPRHHKQYYAVPQVHVPAYDVWIQQSKGEGNKQAIQPFLGAGSQQLHTHPCWFNKHTWCIFSIMIFPSLLLWLLFLYLGCSGLKEWNSHHVPWQDHEDLQTLVTFPAVSSFETSSVALLATVIYILEGLEFVKRYRNYAFWGW